MFRDPYRILFHIRDRADDPTADLDPNKIAIAARELGGAAYHIVKTLLIS